MTSESSLQTAFSQELTHELHLTRRLLERVPTEQFAWRPHPKSTSLGGLAAHMANLLGFLEMSLQGPETDLASGPAPEELPTPDAVLQRFDVNAASIQQALAQVDDATFHAPWTMRHGPQVLLTLPRAAVMRNLVLNHLIHHRGQLSVYLRLLDIPVPRIYGPSADER